jgi:peptidyl-prolyl cis-trans isomerase A (cyclophilin A)
MNRRTILAGFWAAALLGLGCTSQNVVGASDKEVPAKTVADEKAADVFYVKFETSKGDVIIEVHPDWAPIGAAHFKELVENKFYDDCRFFRVLEGFMCQVGMNGDPKVQDQWGEKTIKDDPVKRSNKKGFVTYAKSGLPNSRSTQIFFNYNDRNSQLDSQGFAPFAVVLEGMSVLESLYGDYGEGAPGGNGPDQDSIRKGGNAYLNKSFPKLDYIKTARIVDKSEVKAAK